MQRGHARFCGRGQGDAESWISRYGTQLPDLSKRQEAFLRQQVRASAWVRESHLARSGQQYYTYTFFAVSEQDARQMATLFVNYLDRQAQEHVEHFRKELAEAIEVLKEAPGRIEEYAAKENQANEQMLARRKALGIEREAYESWSRTVHEGRANLRALDIERAGQLARLRAIQEYMAQQTRPAAPSKTASPRRASPTLLC